MDRILVTILLGLACGLSACSKKGEMDDLAKAQQCLDQVSAANPASAASCFSYVEKYDDQQANILKCAILMTSGGLTENKVLKAYNIVKASGQSSPGASFMTVLALDVPDTNTAYDTAVKADGYCQKTGVSGLKFVSGVIVAGTAMSKAMAGLGTTNIDFTDPTAVNNAVQDLLTKCATGAPDPSCPDAATLGTLGGTATNLAESYCHSSDPDPNVCTQVNSAVAAVTAAGGSSADVGQALLCYLNKKTYNPATNQCQ